MKKCSVQEENNFYNQYKEILNEQQKIYGKIYKLKHKRYTIEIDGSVLCKLVDALHAEKICRNMDGYEEYNPFGIINDINRNNEYDIYKCAEMLLEKAKIKEG